MTPRRGSSPRGRGKRQRHAVAGPPERLIPARAGKTRARMRRRHLGAAHPRAGGENATGIVTNGKNDGSSPRGRGKRQAARCGSAWEGLIPARAGKTPRSSTCTGSPWAHPRAGGENRPLRARTPPAGGSSPRGRGKQGPPRDADARRRLIPARAGKTLQARYASNRCGLIPARAGKTSRNQQYPHPSRAHPRAGGENAVQKVEDGAGDGSSPRGRGKPPLV